jgi:hypothetical protein
MITVHRTWARPIFVGLLFLAGASTAFAQGGGGTGTLTGTVVDSTGAALPGATVSATEANTGSIRTVVSNETGLFRILALNPGRYWLGVELAGFRTLTVADINLLTSEIRDLGNLTLEIGALTEIVSVTSEVTPVQVADSSRRATLTIDDLANIQTKGRDVMALLSLLPGGLINIVTKSGTSELKASGWYNGRRDRFNANDYFRKSTGRPKPLYRVNISGYSVGGPVVIPKLMDSRKGDQGP